MKKVNNLLLLGIFLGAGFTVSDSAAAESLSLAQEEIKQQIEQVKKEMKSLDFSQKPVHLSSMIAYFQYYGIHYEDITHFFGSFNSGGRMIAGHVFIPPNARGTVFLLHGYYDHAGMLKNLIAYCLEKQLAVAVYDLPGHGLSGGERVAINKFSEYVTVLNDFINLSQDYLPRPFHLISHSTGSAISFDYLNNTGEGIFTKIIFLAPLVRSSYWKISGSAYHVVSPFLRRVPRIFNKNSSDDDFLEFVKKDPLQDRHVSLKFVEALFMWNEQIKDYSIITKPVLVIQGDLDKVVDWKYNIPFLKKKIKPIKIKMVNNARHHLVNEKRAIRSKVFNIIDEYFTSSNYLEGE